MRTLRKNEPTFFLRREKMIEVFLYLCFAILAGRLFYLQIIMHEKYAKFAGKIQFIENQIPAQRGSIYDRNGNILAMDIPAKTLYIYTRNVDDKDKTARILASILKMPVSEIRKKLDEKYPRIKRKLTIEEYTAIEKEKLKGVIFEDDYKRLYPKGKLACHILGFANVDGTGIEGVELQYNDVLSGETGLVSIPRDGRGNSLISLSRGMCSPVRGKDIYLTID
ncbi:MAG: hypothetical protein NC830_04980 [Candidatus Omnitrophica bacterium]|nr:hypothetical protein [Candidatus Omnitrophota bacterium]